MDYSPVLDYIDASWPSIIREHRRNQGTLIGLPHPYLVPSDAAMFQELYYWPSFFTTLGLLETVHEGRVVDMTENLAYLQRRFGLIPSGSATTGSRVASRLSSPR